jgi:hypothetical protein
MPAVNRWLIWFPIVFTLAFNALIVPRATRHFMVKMTDENYPVELGTFVFCLAAGVMALLLARQLRQRGAAFLYRAFYMAFGVAMMLVAMEEISWGQWFFHFKTPERLSEINTQHEFNLHNIKGMGGHTEYLRLAFGVGGLIGIVVARWPIFQPVAVPRILLSWFIVITLYAAADLYCDLIGRENNFEKAMDVMSEVIEMLIAMSATLYVWMNCQRLVTRRSSSVSHAAR